MLAFGIDQSLLAFPVLPWSVSPANTLGQSTLGNLRQCSLSAV